MTLGEQTTGTRDEYYSLLSTLYHALHGFYNCNVLYALDAEAAGEGELLDYFRKAGVVQERLAKRAKVMLGFTEEEVLPKGLASVSSLPDGTHPSAGARGTAPSGDKSPLSDPLVNAGISSSDEDFLKTEEASSFTSQSEVDRIVPEDLNPTISALEGSITRLDIARAVAEIETWERKLEATGDPELQAIAGHLGALRRLHTANNSDAAAGLLLTMLRKQVQGLASNEVGVQVADKLRRLVELLTCEGHSLSS